MGNKDLIEKAIDGWRDGEERTAIGTVDGYDIRVVKKTYLKQQLGPTSWKVEVYVDDDGPVATEKNNDLNATEAQEQYAALVQKHNLTEK